MSLRPAALALVLLPALACDDAASAPENGEAPQPGSGKADGAAPVSVIELDAFFSPPVATPALLAGGSVSIDYDSQRMYEIYDAAAPIGWFATSFHCYGYGCCETRFPHVDAHHRFDGGDVVTQQLEDGAATFEVPADADTLELWFSSPGVELRTWYCGCDSACSQANRAMAGWRWIDREAWDSRYGLDYVFEVGGWPVVHGEDVKLVEARSIDDVVTGEIEVRDLAWQKQVRVHWTTADAGDAPWQWTDAQFAGMSEGGDFERWSFTIDAPGLADTELRFAIRYDVDGQTFWDNDCGDDYQLAGATIGGRSCG